MPGKFFLREALIMADEITFNGSPETLRLTEAAIGNVDAMRNLKQIGSRALAGLAGLVLWLSGPQAFAQTPPVAAPATAAPARNIRFQFDGIPYSDVIERFSQMVNKPLVTDTNIAGTLTFNDPNTYTYGEALDTLNVVLSMKGVMLVESGNYLRLVPFKEIGRAHV